MTFLNHTSKCGRSKVSGMDMLFNSLLNTKTVKPGRANKIYQELNLPVTRPSPFALKSERHHN